MSAERVADSAAGLMGASGQSVALTREVAFETLSSKRRRYVLHYLLQMEQPVALKELSTQVAAWENDTVCDAVTYKERMRVYTALRQSHLPKMVENNVVTFDEERGLVEPTADAAALKVYLDIVPHNSISWSKYYTGLGVFSLGFVSVNWIGLFPFSLLPSVWCAAIIALLFTCSALVHVARDRKMRLGREGPPPA